MAFRQKPGWIFPGLACKKQPCSAISKRYLAHYFVFIGVDGRGLGRGGGGGGGVGGGWGMGMGPWAVY